MMKNKKFLTIGAAVLLSGVLLLTSALTGNAAGNAYEQLKMLLSEKHEQITNATVQLNMSLTDNGMEVFKVEGKVKVDHESDKASGRILFADESVTKSFDVFHSNNEALFRLTGSENWYRIQRDKELEDRMESRHQRGSSPMKENAQVRDMLLDTLMGDYKDQVSLVESNGLRTFSLTLDENNMPVLLQTLFSADGIHRGERFQEACDLTVLPEELQNLCLEMKDHRHGLELENRKLKSIVLSFSVNEQNHPVGMKLAIDFSGTDTDGNGHDCSMSLNATLSDLGTTVPDEADADPASITTVDTAHMKDAGFGHSFCQ